MKQKRFKKGFFHFQKHYFTLWLCKTDLQPSLVFVAKNSTKLIEIPFEKITNSLWVIPSKKLADNVYYYWFKVQDGRPNASKKYIYVTDPFAKGIERKVEISNLKKDINQDFYAYASVILCEKGKLIFCNENGEKIKIKVADNLPTNDNLVLYELPTRWTKIKQYGQKEIGEGQFNDVKELMNYLEDLGVNALQLLPPADSDQIFEWGYGTSHFFTADADLGGINQFQELINVCKTKGFRFFYDAVMAFAVNTPYYYINYDVFFIPREKATHRQDFGGELFYYENKVKGIDLCSKKLKEKKIFPVQIYMQLHLMYWQQFLGVTDFRLDSINNISCDFFLKKLYSKIKKPNNLVIGEELSMPKELIQEKCVDGLWNEAFKHILREAILGKKSPYVDTFEEHVFQLIDCKRLGFEKSINAINYITSHDVEGRNNERLLDFLFNHGVENYQERIKLAFVCLLTAVGIPMIFAGEEFADAHVLDRMNYKAKQYDPIHFSRFEDIWRKNIHNYVKNLIHFRKNTKALQTDEVEFIHVDCDEDKKIIAWQRNFEKEKVVVVANFSDYVTPNALAEESKYIIPNFPTVEIGQYCYEITQNREVVKKIGKETIFPWEAKVYLIK